MFWNGLSLLVALGLGALGASGVATDSRLATGEIIASFIIVVVLLTRSPWSSAMRLAGCALAVIVALTAILGAHSHIAESRRTMALSLGPIFSAGGRMPVFFDVNRYANELYPVPLLVTLIVKNISPIPIRVDRAYAKIHLDGNWYPMQPLQPSEIVFARHLDEVFPMTLSNPFWVFAADNPIDAKRERRGVLAFEFPAGVLPSQMEKQPPIEITIFDDSGERATINLNGGAAGVENEVGKGLYARAERPEDLSRFRVTSFHQR